jgi:hypothetical protein
MMTSTELAEAVDSATLDMIEQDIRGLIEGLWGRIKSAAEDAEGAGGKNQCKVGIALVVDFSGPTPCGCVTVAFSERTKAECSFRVPDPSQKKLNLEES